MSGEKSAVADKSDVPEGGTGQVKAGLMDWLRLMRLPTVFTAVSNILCGYMITHAGSDVNAPLMDILNLSQLWPLIPAGIGLYLGGMVLNDVFDASLDAVERPERPIPSGKISQRSAGVFGGSLLFLGLVSAGISGLPSLVVAALLVPCILAYNGWLKTTIAAPAGMGACRFLNLMLGASAVPSISDLWQPAALLTATALGVYICGVTLFSREEAVTGSGTSTGLLKGLIIVLTGLVIDLIAISLFAATPHSLRGGRMAVLLLGVNLMVRGAAAITTPAPKLTQKTVGLMLLSLIFLDAIMVFAITGDARRAILIITLIAPATLLRRIIPMS